MFVLAEFFSAVNMGHNFNETKRFLVHHSTMYMAAFANKSIVKKRVKYIFVYIVRPFSMSCASPSVPRSLSLFLSHHWHIFFLFTSHQTIRTTKQTIVSFFGWPTLWFLAYSIMGERERENKKTKHTHSNWLFRQIFGKKRSCEKSVHTKAMMIANL